MGQDQSITDITTPELPWDTRFVATHFVLGLAAACWILWASVLEAIPDEVLLGLAIVVVGAVVLWRLSVAELVGTMIATASAGLGWWGCRHGWGNTAAYVSALPAGVLLWVLASRPRDLDTSGMWTLPHARGTALGCWAVAACGVSSILVLLIDGDPNIQLPLVFVWMSISFWPAIESDALMKRATRSVTCDAAARAELLSHRFGAVLGTAVVPWLIASGAFFAEVLTKPPVVVIAQSVPLSVQAVPLALGLSSFFSFQLLLTLLMAPIRAGMEGVN